MSLLDVLTETLTSLKVGYHVIPPEKVSQYWRTEWNYHVGRELKPAWETIPGGVGCQDKKGWQWMSEAFGEDTIMLMPEPNLNAVGIELEGRAIPKLLGETEGFVVYLGRSDGSSMVCFNDHDVVIAWRDAVPWIQARSRKGATT